MKITMRKEILRGYTKKPAIKRDYLIKKIAFYIYGFKNAELVFKTFINLATEKIPDLDSSINVAILKAKTLRDLNAKEHRLYHEWTQFKSVCFSNRRISKKIKETCICKDMTKCMLVECDCDCHREHKFFFPKAWVLSALDKALLSLEHLDFNDNMTQAFIHNKQISNLSKVNICLKCYAKYGTNTKCHTCNLLPGALSRTSVT